MDEQLPIVAPDGALAGAVTDSPAESEESDLGGYLLDPVLLAILFSVVSLPIVALCLNTADYGLGLGADYMPIQVPVTDLGRWAGALGSVLAAGFVAGTMGALLVRASALWGSILTIVIAWVVAIAALPVLPALLNANHRGALGFGSVCPIGPGTCNAAIAATDAASGVREVWLFWLAPFVEPIPFGVLVLGVAYWGRLVRTWDREPSGQATLYAR